MTIDQAKAAYARGYIDADELEQMVSDVLDGTEAKRQQVQAEGHCVENGHLWLQREEDIDPLRCAMCGKPWGRVASPDG